MSAEADIIELTLEEPLRRMNACMLIYRAAFDGLNIQLSLEQAGIENDATHKSAEMATQLIAERISRMKEITIAIDLMRSLNPLEMAKAIDGLAKRRR